MARTREVVQTTALSVRVNATPVILPPPDAPLVPLTAAAPAALGASSSDELMSDCIGGVMGKLLLNLGILRCANWFQAPQNEFAWLQLLDVVGLASTARGRLRPLLADLKRATTGTVSAGPYCEPTAHQLVLRLARQVESVMRETASLSTTGAKSVNPFEAYLYDFEQPISIPSQQALIDMLEAARAIRPLPLYANEILAKLEREAVDLAKAIRPPGEMLSAAKVWNGRFRSLSEFKAFLKRHPEIANSHRGQKLFVASMGPRSFDRGRYWLLTVHYANREPLQWGRDLLIAEGRSIA